MSSNFPCHLYVHSLLLFIHTHQPTHILTHIHTYIHTYINRWAGFSSEQIHEIQTTRGWVREDCFAIYGWIEYHHSIRSIQQISHCSTSLPSSTFLFFRIDPPLIFPFLIVSRSIRKDKGLSLQFFPTDAAGGRVLGPGSKSWDLLYPRVFLGERVFVVFDDAHSDRWLQCQHWVSHSRIRCSTQDTVYEYFWHYVWVLLTLTSTGIKKKRLSCPNIFSDLPRFLS